MAKCSELSTDSLTRLSNSLKQLPPGRSYVVGAAIFRYTASSPGEPELLILKRSQYETSFPNVWEIPGGKVEPGETVRDAVVRETKEETGLTVADIVGEISEMRWVGGKSGKESVQWNFVVQVKDEQEVKTSIEEHEVYDWIRHGEWVQKGYSATEKMVKVFEEAFAFMTRHHLQRSV